MESKGNGSKIFRLQYENHSNMIASVFCSMLEKKSLVDIVLRCGHHSVNAHKCILAANSAYFREHLEKDKTIQQIIISKVNFSVVRSMIEYMYCGETSVDDDNVNYLVAAAKLFKIRGLLALSKIDNNSPDVNIEIPEPVFLSDDPKYSETYLYMTPVGPVKLDDTADSSKKPNRKYECFPVEELRKELEISKNLDKSLPKKRSKPVNFEPPNPRQKKVDPILPKPVKFDFKTLPEPYSIDSETLKPKPPVRIDFESLASKPLNVDFGTLASEPVEIDFETIAPQLAKLADLTVINPEQGSAADKLKEIFGGDVPPTVEIMFENDDGTLSALTQEELKSIDQNYFEYRLVEDNAVDIKDADQIAITDPEEDPVAKYLNLDATIGDSSKQSKESPKPSTSKSFQQGNTDGAGVSGIRKSFLTPDVLIPHSQFYDELSDSSD